MNDSTLGDIRMPVGEERMCAPEACDFADPQTPMVQPGGCQSGLATVAVSVITHILGQEVGLAQPLLGADGLQELLQLGRQAPLGMLTASSTTMGGVQATLHRPAPPPQRLSMHAAHRPKAAWVGRDAGVHCPMAQSNHPTPQSLGP
ncbi:hypothetical protein MDA_GLEAN10014209 [Myotis davidii]|uniref:Uncharacterized protein n=1 Tax=Myotis davidii TaxID=225400 RepID=L5M3Z7_MYODS|nr:hypothetical protein MDA_GLEAN10014209 [Myotis davidii]